ncbi:MAG: mRNA surveillance protein pelota [archaeon]|jgi:protein pelota
MKVLKISKKEAEITAIPETMDDLWHLEKIIDKNDTVYGTTDRKIKPSKEGEKTIRQTIFVELQVIDAHFQEFSENLKINGIIIGGHPEEFIELKSHQSLEIKIGEKLKLKKQSLKDWQIDRIKKAEKSSAAAKLLVILIDDEQAELAFINQFSINRKATIKESKKGKRFDTGKSDYFDQILEKIQLLDAKKILLAGPGFVKENFKKFVDDKKIKGFPQVLVENTNSVGDTGFNEIISQGKLASVEKELQLSKEGKTIEDFLMKISKGKAEYGFEKVKSAIELGACEKLIISETQLMQKREESESILDLAEKMGCEAEIISSKNPQEKQIHSFGGIVCTLRYRVE